MNAPRVVTTADGLARLCDQLGPIRSVGVDTEFMRTDTYYARLCLVQIATDEMSLCVDPLAVDIAPLLGVLYAPSLRLILHAARQDLELFVDLRGVPPTNLFDTQIAAAFAGFDEQIGYGPLVAALTNHKPAKLHTRTDWARRPLPVEALHYAEEDVRFLPTLENQLRERLIALGRLAWAEADFAALCDPSRYRNDPARSYERINAGRSLPPRAQTILRELAAWREHTAQRLDRPRGWIAADQLLVAIARRAPATAEQLVAIENMPPALVRKHASALIEAVERGQHGDAEPLWPAAQPLSTAEQNRLKRLQAHVAEAAGKLAIAPSLLANRRELTALATGGDAGRLLHGWRREVIGDDLRAMCA